ncbi:MAG: hypothetical protein Q4D98_03490 [Planctomycetia bacterium]|nr:hypothetical protein [Planctomycetia bacterium]
MDMSGWLTTIGPWGVMCLVVERLTNNHARALADVTKSLKTLEETVGMLAVIVAKVEGMKQEQEEE